MNYVSVFTEKNGRNSIYKKQEHSWGRVRTIHLEQGGDNRSKPTTKARVLDAVAPFLVLLGICSVIQNWSAYLSVF